MGLEKEDEELGHTSGPVASSGMTVDAGAGASIVRGLSGAEVGMTRK